MSEASDQSQPIEPPDPPAEPALPPGAETASRPPPAAGELRRPERRAFRARRERFIGGVCGGIALAYGTDPALIRSLTALSCFVGGAGFLLYGVALFLLPLEPIARARPRPEGAPRQDVGMLWLGIGTLLVGLPLLSLVDPLDLSLLSLERGALWPAALIALMGVTAATRGRRARGRPLPAWLGRPREDRLIGGVASGFARYAMVDANLVRLVLAVVALWSRGMGILLYLLLVAFLPEERRA